MERPRPTPRSTTAGRKPLTSPDCRNPKVSGIPTDTTDTELAERAREVAERISREQSEQSKAEQAATGPHLNYGLGQQTPLRRWRATLFAIYALFSPIIAQICCAATVRVCGKREKLVGARV